MDLSPLKSTIDGKREGEDGAQSVGNAKSQLWDKGRGRELSFNWAFVGGESESTEQGR